jgi:RNA polymerase sigma-70 factor (ECF subfamily)
MTDCSDDELMRLSGQGDRAAFGRLVARHAARAGALAARVTGNASDAEEIVQEALLRTWLKAPEWTDRASGGAAFTTWFSRIVVNLAIDRRRRPRNARLDEAGEIAEATVDAFDRAAAGEIATRLARAMADLPERQRAALALCHYDGRSNIEAADILGISVGALESLLVRARKSLRGALADLIPS